jgi:hypothetical protein
MSVISLQYQTTVDEWHVERRIWIASANIGGMTVGESGRTPLDAMTSLAEKLAYAVTGAVLAEVNKPDPDEKMHKVEP